MFWTPKNFQDETWTLCHAACQAMWEQMCISSNRFSKFSLSRYMCEFNWGSCTLSCYNDATVLVLQHFLSGKDVLVQDDTRARWSLVQLAVEGCRESVDAGQRGPSLRERSPRLWHSKRQCWCHGSSWLPPGEWHLHLSIMSQICTQSGWVGVDLFASNQNNHCLL